ncbi:CheY-like chemotaxis protein [Rhodopirellula rubra]|uniref:CheY-like chemotaxis protein n=1 Tax=Aporhodopirellula rubra TaxID=980271 RepID=A0A7W5E418_9BACT|nr:response regulator [Aporhodopirellula rubra]MBB3209188.1 CheY-like chemotaxis protein [Aporhodopirellula rubra]
MNIQAEQRPKRRVVVADDLRSIREQVVKWLTEMNFECIVAVNGAAAMQSVRTQKPDLLITDIDMPELSGLHLIYRMRTDPGSAICRIPAVVMSSMDDDHVQHLALRAGASAFVAKPLDKDSFQASVLKSLDDPVVVDVDSPQSWIDVESNALKPKSKTSPRSQRIIRTDIG